MITFITFLIEAISLASDGEFPCKQNVSCMSAQWSVWPGVEA